MAIDRSYSNYPGTAIAILTVAICMMIVGAINENGKKMYNK